MEKTSPCIYCGEGIPLPQNIPANVIGIQQAHDHCVERAVKRKRTI